MTRKQIALIIGINALLATLISVAVTLILGYALQPRQSQAQLTPTAQEATTAVAGQPQPTEEPVIHVIQSGDTISGLAFQYDIPEEDIIAANQLQNPNFLQVGTELVIPVGGLPEVSPTPTAAPTATDTPIPFEPPSADMTATAAALAGATTTPLPTPLPASGESQIVISEIQAPGQVEQEKVVITNNGDKLADLAGWTLSDPEGNTYTFPNIRLWQAGSITVHTRMGQDNSPQSNFYWGKLQAMWAPGEIVSLKDSEGKVVSTITAGPE